MLVDGHGSSPRRRGTPQVRLSFGPPLRIIPAQAGNTSVTFAMRALTPDHPRAGGEHIGESSEEDAAIGSSPRRRGTLYSPPNLGKTSRIIPAQAGNTSPMACTRSAVTDHPRAGGEHQPTGQNGRANGGSSPRRRGTHALRHDELPDLRIIPAQAGNTHGVVATRTAAADHPRAGGEHNRRSGRPSCSTGSSPRRRGTLPVLFVVAPHHRIIPAQAGNTSNSPREVAPRTDHPRAGGEHSAHVFASRNNSGSSPRRRGTLPAQPGLRAHDRIIPAQAGNTPSSRRRRRRYPDHPRAGGEHFFGIANQVGEPGSSPRRRGTPGGRLRGRHRIRIIPAQAGNTAAVVLAHSLSPDHPRAGGEHVDPDDRYTLEYGSSPRRRGTREDSGPHTSASRIIPAQAGNTAHFVGPDSRHADHPRAGGEHTPPAIARRPAFGSSPRRRGTRRPAARNRCRPRIIPAQAGNTCCRTRRSRRSTDHPRAGGEHLFGLTAFTEYSGSSPRRRGTLLAHCAHST